MINVAMNSWKAICSYYACYDIIYAFLQKYGIKCEIHYCSIEVLSLFDNISDEDINFIKKLKENRIYAQYYVNKNFSILDSKKIKLFVLKIKEMIYYTKPDDIKKFRDKLKNLI